MPFPQPDRNPAVEDQAIDRVHRLGQTRPVTIKRYFIADSVEEKLLKLQDRKRAVADGALNFGEGERQQLGLDDFIYLFS
jgi:SNF2 family DNA or RNA helicase